MTGDCRRRHAPVATGQRASAAGDAPRDITPSFTSRDSIVHPCLACGACCAAFRVDFAVEELDDNGGCVPAGLAVEVTARTWRMRGTDHQPMRCAALTGRIGEKAACGIYEWRPNPCRELEPGSDACLRARARHGLPPLPML